ncbi:MAG: isoamylase [Chthoniobacter sp.]|jgi:glycogen operon protein|nr:isoamylase [Chthoniobacter sp.]
MTRTQHPVWLGNPYPLGATLTAEGVNFALFSEHARAVDLCFFDSPDAQGEARRIRLTERTEHIWHCFVPGVRAGQLYGYRVHGPHRPTQGSRFNSTKLLIDPCAKAIAGGAKWGQELFGYPHDGGDDRDLKRDLRDSAWGVPKSVVVDDAFDWGGVQPPRIRLADSIIYEVHVKGFSKLAPELPETMRGTYAALGTPWAIDYFKRLGVTAIELLPVHHFLDEPFLMEKGLSNYWGYNSMGYFAPHSAYSGSGLLGEQVAEFKQMVKDLHAAGLEVILDVVYNHTAEGNHFGPTLCFRGIDNATYYRLMPEHRRYYRDYTGCGNSLNTRQPRVLQFVMDSLRYWVTQMHVDGFRFDLASTLAREEHAVDPFSGFFDILMQDPVLSRVKLIAEPWDVGEGGYQVGAFPVYWSEWNGKYRDCVRSYLKGDEGTIGEFASRLTGSSDLYEHNGRRPYASINFITCHDGFTLQDVVSYNEKHNEANGEGNRDGESHNRSWNCGAEGPTDDEEINTLRRRQVRNFLTTLILSQGVPMLCAGDEYGRTQLGNNNTYCQDNELNWLSWSRTERAQEREDFTRRLIELRRKHPIFRRTKYFHGRKIPGARMKDILWISDSGREMANGDWSAHVRALGVVFVGFTSDVRDDHGTPIRDDSFMLLFNAHHGPVAFVLAGQKNVRWELFLDTREERGFLEVPRAFASGDELELAPYSQCVLRLTRGSEEHARSASWKPRPEPEPPPEA